LLCRAARRANQLRDFGCNAFVPAHRNYTKGMRRNGNFAHRLNAIALAAPSG
jgi:hypothetical protein